MLRCVRGALLSWLVVILPLFCSIARAQQDIQVTGGSGTNPYIIIGRGLSWAGSGMGNLNNNFIFHPVTPDEGFCLFITNNNPSNSHSATVAVFQSGDPAQNLFTGFAQRWSSVPTVTVFPVTVNALSIVGINFKTTASAGITVQFSGGGVQAGNPDTADVFAVQTTQSSCGALASNSVQGPFAQGGSITTSQQFPVLIGGLLVPGSTTQVQGFAVGQNANGFVLDSKNSSLFGNGFVASPVANTASPQGVKIGGTSRDIVMGTISMTNFGNSGLYGGGVKTDLLEFAQDQSAAAVPGYNALGKLTNPASGATVLHQFNQISGTSNVQFKRLSLSCTVACEITVNRTTAQGTTCTALTLQNLNLWAGTRRSPAATDVVENNCTGSPTINGVLYDLQLGAGVPFVVDLTGFALQATASGGSGLAVQVVTTFTGVASASLSSIED